jgi:GT2 family glycosyltransferase
MKELVLRIAVSITCFNRKELTLAALERLFAQEFRSSESLSVYLVDDGSTDGTAEAVTGMFPQVDVLRGDGSLFWNGGMRKALEAAMQVGYDYYLWLNDDGILYSDAIERLISCAEEYRQRDVPAIITGTMVSPTTGERTYGGQAKRIEGLKVHFDAVHPDPLRPIECSTMNGNLVLVPDVVARRLVNLDPIFRHQIGDVDYGLRAAQAGFRVVTAPGTHGVCSDNSRDGTWRDGSIPLKSRWRQIMSPKGAPPREWIHYVRRHFGWRWPFYAVSPYLKALVSGTKR